MDILPTMLFLYVLFGLHCFSVYSLETYFSTFKRFMAQESVRLYVALNYICRNTLLRYFSAATADTGCDVVENIFVVFHVWLKSDLNTAADCEFLASVLIFDTASF